MGTLISLMNTSLSALQATQAALNATANNVANQNTVGYTRQTVQFSARDSVSLNGVLSYGVSAGSGPVSQRDRVLEQRVQQQTQLQSQSAAVESALQQIQNIFSLSSTSASASTTELGAATDSFFSSLTALASNPMDTVTRQAVLSAASGLAAAFNSAANQLAGVKSSLNQQVESVVGQVNSLTASIATLNGQIASLSPNADVGTLEDQRQQAIAQLSQYIGMDQVSNESNGITLTTADGHVLVSGSSSYALSTSQASGSTDVLTAAGQDITSAITGGQLGGILSVRATELPGVSSAIDTLANTIASNVNQQLTLGIDANVNPGQALLSGAIAGSFTAASLAVAITDPKLIAAAGNLEGNAGNANAQALANLSTANVAGGTTVSAFYASLLNQLGSAASSASADTAQQQTGLTQLTTARDALSGVSADQEAANLTQYQRSYQAAARVFSIVTSLMADAINLGVTTSVS